MTVLLNKSDKWVFPSLALEQENTDKLGWEGPSIHFNGWRSFYGKRKPPWPVKEEGSFFFQR